MQDTKQKWQKWKFSVWFSREKNDNEFVRWLVFDLRVGLITNKIILAKLQGQWT